EQRPGAVEIAVFVMRPGVSARRAQRVMPVAELAELPHALAEELLRSRPVAFPPGGVGDHETRESGARGVAELLVELECLSGPTRPPRDVPPRPPHGPPPRWGLGREPPSDARPFGARPRRDGGLPPDAPSGPRSARARLRAA